MYPAIIGSKERSIDVNLFGSRGTRYGHLWERIPSCRRERPSQPFILLSGYPIRQRQQRYTLCSYTSDLFCSSICTRRRLVWWERLRLPVRSSLVVIGKGLDMSPACCDNLCIDSDLVDAFCDVVYEGVAGPGRRKGCPSFCQGTKVGVCIVMNSHYTVTRRSYQ